MALTDTRGPGPAPTPHTTPGPRPTSKRPAASARAGGPPPRRRVPWARTLLLGVTLAAALASLHVVLQGISWWMVGTVAIFVVLISAAATRAALRGWIWPPIAAAVAGIALVTVGYAADTAILGVIPTPGTVLWLATLVSEGAASIAVQNVPATPELGIVLLVVVLMIAAAWASDAVLAAGRPALVALPLGAILVVPIAVKPGLGDVLWFVVTAALYLALLRLGRPRDSRRVVVVVGAAVTLGALLLPNLLPPVGEAETRRGGLRTGLNPFITLGDDLRRGDPTLALSYTTTAKGPVYLRLSTLDEFTGVTWKPSLDPVGDMGTQPVDAFPDPVGLAAETVVAEATVSVTVGGVLSKWLPTPYPTRSIEGVVGDWFWEPNGLAVRTIDSNARGQQYTSTFLEVSPTAELLAGTPTWDPSTAPFDALALPEQGLPEIIASTAHRLGDGAASAFDKALALQTYLRSSQFTYSEQTPVDGGFDGSGLDALAVFFDVKSGYCVHYASAMAVMARELGIPSRVAVGFQPGQRSLADGVSTYEVSTDDLHAWPELYLEGAGWTRFEPTPSRGVVPTFSTLLIDDPTTPEDESSPAPSAAPTTAPGERPDVDDPASDPVAQSVSRLSAALLTGLAIVAGALALLLLPAAVRGGVRMLRVRRIRQGRDAARAAWDEVRDTARDVGWSAPETETPREFAARLAPQLSGAALGEFRGQVEAAAFGRPDARGLSPAELAWVRRSILRSAGLRTRMMAFLLPASLLRRWRPDIPLIE